MNCFKWNSSCITPPQSEGSACAVPLWFWLLAAAGVYMVAKGKR
jgi:hypothetical protein